MVSAFRTKIPDEWLLHMYNSLESLVLMQILVDGVPLNELDIRWFRERIGFVGQEPRLFRMDVSSNIKYGCPREVSHKEVMWAAKQAYAHDFIMSLPNGYNTIVADPLLSGGQKQRVAIAPICDIFLIANNAGSAHHDIRDVNQKSALPAPVAPILQGIYEWFFHVHAALKFICSRRRIMIHVQLSFFAEKCCNSSSLLKTFLVGVYIRELHLHVIHNRNLENLECNNLLRYKICLDGADGYLCKLVGSFFGRLVLCILIFIRVNHSRHVKMILYLVKT